MSFFRKIIIYVFILISFFISWIIVGNAYVTNAHKAYLACIFRESPSNYRHSVEIYTDFRFMRLRENCALSLGTEWSELDELIGYELSKMPIWERILVFPSYLIKNFKSD